MEATKLAITELGPHYLKFRTIQETFESEGVIDLSDVSFFNPCLLSPLAILISKHPEAEVREPSSENARSYYNFMTEMMKKDYEFNEFQRDTIAGPSYIRMIKVPRKPERFTGFSQMISDDTITGKYGGGNAIVYLVGEVTDNVFQHSGFDNSWVTIQMYPNKGRMELCVIDDGISIPGSLESAGYTFAQGDANAISQAVGGLSAKLSDGARGAGLRTVAKLLVRGMKGEVLILSRGGILSRRNGTLRRESELLYQTNEHPFPGTLVGMMIPEQSTDVNIYDYIE